MTVLSKTFDGQVDRTEQWYGTKYSVRPIDEAVLERWTNCVAAKRLGIDYPKPNQFIPSETGLRVKNPPNGNEKRRKTFEEKMQPLVAPRVIRDDGPGGRWTIYFKEDDRFGKPKGFVILQILTKELYGSAFNAALASLYEICVMDRLGEYAYDGKLFVPFVVSRSTSRVGRLEL